MQVLECNKLNQKKLVLPKRNACSILPTPPTHRLGSSSKRTTNLITKSCWVGLAKAKVTITSLMLKRPSTLGISTTRMSLLHLDYSKCICIIISIVMSKKQPTKITRIQLASKLPKLNTQETLININCTKKKTRSNSSKLLLKFSKKLKMYLCSRPRKMVFLTGLQLKLRSIRRIARSNNLLAK